MKCRKKIYLTKVWLLIEDGVETDESKILGYYTDEHRHYAEEWVSKHGRLGKEYFLVEAIWLQKVEEQDEEVDAE